MVRNSIFRKQLILYMGIITVLFLVIGIALSTIFTDFYYEQKELELISQAKKVSEQYVGIYENELFDFSKLEEELMILEEYIKSTIFYVNSRGEVIIASSDISNFALGQVLTGTVLDVVLDGKIIVVKGTLDNIVTSSVLAVGYPIIARRKPVGAIFMLTSLPEIKESVNLMYRIIFICQIISIIIGCILVFYSSKKISAPLLLMNDVSKVIANGNFEKRIHIKSDDEVGQLATSFNFMAESLLENEKVRRELVANISHDLRSPLTSIQGFVNAILDGTIPKEKTEHYLGIIIDETKRLNKLADSVIELNLAQNSNILLDKTNFDVNTLILNTFESIYPRFLEKNITQVTDFFEDTTIVYADYEKIQRVLQNLIDNAVKFSNNDSEVIVKTTIHEADNKVFISVKDNGIGVSEDKQRYVFERFFKEDSSRGKDKKAGDRKSVV